MGKNVRGCGIKTVVRGVRVEPMLWERLGDLAKEMGLTRNEMIVSALYEYHDKKSLGKFKKDIDKGEKV
jgi:predicted DNA-binding ribbon-helix-helix protein